LPFLPLRYIQSLLQGGRRQTQGGRGEKGEGGRERKGGSRAQPTHRSFRLPTISTLRFEKKMRKHCAGGKKNEGRKKKRREKGRKGKREQSSSRQAGHPFLLFAANAESAMGKQKQKKKKKRKGGDGSLPGVIFFLHTSLLRRKAIGRKKRGKGREGRGKLETTTRRNHALAEHLKPTWSGYSSVKEGEEHTGSGRGRGKKSAVRRSSRLFDPPPSLHNVPRTKKRRQAG